MGVAARQEDKQREASNGHDGTWIAHPGLADTAMAVFNQALGDHPNQLHVLRHEDAPVQAEQLLAPCEGDRTEAGMRANIRVALQYLEAWISGNGCVPIDGLMEDAATAEIARTSIWQWIHHKKTLRDGQQVTASLFQQLLNDELHTLQMNLGDKTFSSGRYEEAARLMAQITTENELVPFLTLPGYRLLPDIRSGCHDTYTTDSATRTRLAGSTLAGNYPPLQRTRCYLAARFSSASLYAGRAGCR